jgi:hypothetical protein
MSQIAHNEPSGADAHGEVQTPVPPAARVGAIWIAVNRHAMLKVEARCLILWP